ncbi:MAG: hypothetical protein M0Z99_24385 [Betaproteobacteria bacterium]|nr:hypothetical protein [Betaproteobacteria bacterium]
MAALAFINLPNSQTAEEETDRLGIKLAWYYLDIAADKLGFAAAANKSHAEALRLSAQKNTACANGFILTCGSPGNPRQAAQVRRQPAKPRLVVRSGAPAN